MAERKNKGGTMAVRFRRMFNLHLTPSKLLLTAGFLVITFMLSSAVVMAQQNSAARASAERLFEEDAAADSNADNSAGSSGNNFTNTITVSMSNAFEQQRYDGWYNNLGHPDWGSIESHLTRKTPPSYGDGVYTMSGQNRPSPRQLSQAFMKGLDGLGSLKNRTALQTFFGQVKKNYYIIFNDLMNLLGYSSQ